jgi:hypothetical protein
MHAVGILCLWRAIDRIWQRFGVWERREKERSVREVRKRISGRPLGLGNGRAWGDRAGQLQGRREAVRGGRWN